MSTNAPPLQNAPAKEFSCRVSVEALGATYEGRASGQATSSNAFLLAAQAEACKKLLDATGIDCKDDARVLPSTLSSVQIIKGVGSASSVVRLTAVAAVQVGSASSELGGREACLAAVENACKTAPAGSDCGPKHLACDTDETGKAWSCGPIRKRPLRDRALVPPDPLSDPFSGK